VSGGADRRPQHEVPYLHIRPSRRVVGVGGEGDRPVAKITANKAGLLALRGQIDGALAAEEGEAAEGRYRETDEAGYDPSRSCDACVGGAVAGGWEWPPPLSL
jgi:hypothetical protein